MPNLKHCDDDCSNEGRGGTPKQKSKGQILYILMTKYVNALY